MTDGQPTTRPSQDGALTRRAFASLLYLSLFGMALLFANIGLSFEEPHWVMLTVAAILLMAGPLGMLIHLASTSEMTRVEKRLWLSGLAGRKGPILFAAYFDTTARARVTHMLVSLHRGRR
jgi:hypothetical protein